MTRRLMLLNLALLALLALLVYRFKEVSAASREREARVLGQKIEARKYPPLPAAPPVKPAVGANYIDIATRMLLAKDRNPTVIIDPEPVKEKPKMPPLPVVQGLMNFGDPGLIMSDKPGAVQKTYHKGEKVGPFKLVAFDSDHVVLDWDGEKVERKLDELLEKGPAPPPPGSAAPGAQAPSIANTAPLPSATPQGPGVDIGGGFKGCQPNDSTPSGTVQNGLKKVEIATPFGRSCRWEPAK
jgi:hypothetical protein